MEKYPKIETLFNRDEKTFKVKLWEWRIPEFEFLQDCNWIFTEKIDGTNIRVDWNSKDNLVTFGGRTDNAQIPVFLLNKLQELFTITKFQTLYPETNMTLYGEGYGARIQKGGGNYISNGVNFALFDVLIDNKWWLEIDNVKDISSKLEIKLVPILSAGKILDAVERVQKGFNSTFGDFQAEGIVLRPYVELQRRNGQRILAKIKTKDF